MDASEAPWLGRRRRGELPSRQGLDRCHELVLAHGTIPRPHEPSLRIDYGPVRLVGKAIQPGNLPISIVSVGEGEMVPLDKSPACPLVVQEPNANESHTGVLPIFVDTLPPGGVVVAGRSPGGPKQQDDRRSPEIVQAQRLAVEKGQREARGERRYRLPQSRQNGESRGGDACYCGEPAKSSRDHIDLPSHSAGRRASTLSPPCKGRLKSRRLFPKPQDASLSLGVWGRFVVLPISPAAPRRFGKCGRTAAIPEGSPTHPHFIMPCGLSAFHRRGGGRHDTIRDNSRVACMESTGGGSPGQR